LGPRQQSGFRSRLYLTIAARAIRVRDGTLGVRSRSLLMVIAQQPTQSLAALNRLLLVVPVRGTRKQQDVTLPLVIALSMIIFDVFAPRPPQGPLAEKDHLGQALLLHRPDPALRIGIQVRAVRRQRQWFNLT
jgi:hypothetical protein